MHANKIFFCISMALAMGTMHASEQTPFLGSYKNGRTPPLCDKRINGNTALGALYGCGIGVGYAAGTTLLSSLFGHTFPLGASCAVIAFATTSGMIFGRSDICLASFSNLVTHLHFKLPNDDQETVP